MDSLISLSEQKFLLDLARKSIDTAIRHEVFERLDFSVIPPRLQAKGGCFVTLTRQGELRGCIGTLEPYQSLVEDVREHAVAAALQDYRFPPVTMDELAEIQIEISVLSLPQPISYEQPLDLPKVIRPGIDGVVLRDGNRRATFLPQVWHQLRDPCDFLDHLCKKMGAQPGLWRQRKLGVAVYQVFEFSE